MALVDKTDQDLCRICTEPQDTNNLLFSPCRCSGSIRWVHQGCLRAWMLQSKEKTCGLCGHQITFKKYYKDNVPSKLPAFISLFEIAKRLSYTIARVFRATTISLIWIITVPLVAISALRLLWRAVPSNVHALAGSYVTQVDRTSLGIELINGQVLCLALLLGYLFLWLCARWVQIVELPITPGRMAPLPPVPPLRNNLPLEPPPLVPSPLGLRPTDLSEHNIVPATEFQNSQRSKWHADADPQAQKEVGRQRQGLQEYDDRLLERKKLHLEGVTVDQLVEGNGKSSLKFASARSNDQVKYLDRRFLKAKNLLPRDGPIMIEAEDVLVERAASRRFTLRIQMTKSIARRSRNRRQVLPNAKACTNFENTAVSSVVSLPDVTFSPRKPIPYPLAPSLINEQPAEGLASGVIVSNTWDIEQRDSPNASMQKDSERASNCPVPSNHPVPNNRSVSGDRPVPHLQFPPEVLLAGVPPIPERPDWNAPIQHQMRQPILGLTRVFRDMVIVIKVLAINGQIYSVLCQAYFITFMATAGLGLSIWTAHSIGRALLYMLGVITSGPWDQTLAVCVGYLLIFLASLVTLHLRSSTLNESSRRKLRNLKFVINFLSETVVVPCLCGFTMSICGFRFSWHHFFQVPIIVVFCHWILGIAFVETFCWILAGCKGLFRPGALWFVQIPWLVPRTSRTLSVLQKTLIYFFAAACVTSYVSLCLQPILPLNNRKLDVFNCILLYLSARAIFRYRLWTNISLLFASLLKLLARQLCLTSYLFGIRPVDEERSPPFFRADRRSTSSGSFNRVPFTDDIHLAGNMRAMVEVSALGVPTNDASKRMVRQQYTNATQAGRNVRQDYTVVYIPPNFSYRCFAFVVLLWTVVTVSCILILRLSIIIGRTFPHVKENDLCSLFVGSGLLWYFSQMFHHFYQSEKSFVSLVAVLRQRFFGLFEVLCTTLIIPNLVGAVALLYLPSGEMDLAKCWTAGLVLLQIGQIARSVCKTNLIPEFDKIDTLKCIFSTRAACRLLLIVSLPLATRFTLPDLSDSGVPSIALVLACLVDIVFITGLPEPWAQSARDNYYLIGESLENYVSIATE